MTSEQRGPGQRAFPTQTGLGCSPAEYNTPMGNPLQEQDLFDKIRSLPEEKVAEVADFVDFLRHREDDRRLVQAASRLSEDALRKVWDNDDDAEYDRL
jgi:hypothetical protein